MLWATSGIYVVLQTSPTSLIRSLPQASAITSCHHDEVDVVDSATDSTRTVGPVPSVPDAPTPRLQEPSTQPRQHGGPSVIHSTSFHCVRCERPFCRSSRPCGKVTELSLNMYSVHTKRYSSNVRAQAKYSAVL